MINEGKNIVVVNIDYKCTRKLGLEKTFYTSWISEQFKSFECFRSFKSFRRRNVVEKYRFIGIEIHVYRL